MTWRAVAGVVGVGEERAVGKHPQPGSVSESAERRDCGSAFVDDELRRASVPDGDPHPRGAGCADEALSAGEIGAVPAAVRKSGLSWMGSSGGSGGSCGGRSWQVGRAAMAPPSSSAIRPRSSAKFNARRMRWSLNGGAATLRNRKLVTGRGLTWTWLGWCSGNDAVFGGSAAGWRAGRSSCGRARARRTRSRGVDALLEGPSAGVGSVVSRT